MSAFETVTPALVLCNVPLTQFNVPVPSAAPVPSPTTPLLMVIGPEKDGFGFCRLNDPTPAIVRPDVPEMTLSMFSMFPVDERSTASDGAMGEPKARAP